jgi:hypothetical protein
MVSARALTGLFSARHAVVGLSSYNTFMLYLVESNIRLPSFSVPVCAYTATAV